MCLFNQATWMEIYGISTLVFAFATEAKADGTAFIGSIVRANHTINSVFLLYGERVKS